ncbi:MAG: RidA family protein [Oscillospiraceae bacterium]|nr:RidA family protein [Oscillospiraceae bacterium]
MSQIICADHAPAALGPYSHAVWAGNLLFTSGQIGIVPETGALAAPEVEAQTHQVFQNLKAVLTAAELTLSDVVKTTVFLTDMGDFAAVNKIYGTYFSENPPARSCIQVAALPAGAKIEIEVIAEKSN